MMYDVVFKSGGRGVADLGIAIVAGAAFNAG